MLASFGARACNVPVFRFALEAWTSGDYDLHVFHRGPLNANDKALLEGLERDCAAPKEPVNILVHAVDVAQVQDMNARVRQIWSEQKEPGNEKYLPRAVLCYPDSSDVAWSGLLSAGIARQLAHSPARTELAKRIAGGASIVFVLLESGNATLDAPAAALLQKTLPELQAELKLPAGDDLDEGPPRGHRLQHLPLRLNFSILRLSRSDAAEQAFIDQLMRADNSLNAALPSVFPIFGRGRVLCGLSGTKLNAQILEQATMFLSGACSCQAKELNPGTDLLMAVNWDDLLNAADASSIERFVAPVLSPTRPLADSPTHSFSDPPIRPLDAAPVSSMMLWAATVLAAILVVVTGRRVLKSKQE